jgi:hypothetical protein
MSETQRLSRLRVRRGGAARFRRRPLLLPLQASRCITANSGSGPKADVGTRAHSLGETTRESRPLRLTARSSVRRLRLLISH